MWFKNLRMYRFLRSFELDADTVADRLASKAFSACGRLQESSFGFVPPGGADEAGLVHATNGFLLMSGCREEKLLPGSVVKEAAAERIEAMEAERGHKVAKRERDRIHDDVRFELLPRAFTRSQKTFAYIDPVDGYLAIDASTDARADEFMDALHEALGELPVAFPQTHERPASVMTRWLADGYPAEGIDIEDECELRLPGDGGAVVRCRNQDLGGREIQVHLEAGKEAIRLGLVYDDRIRFVLDEKLAVRRLRFLEVIQDQVDEIDADSASQRLDADFAVMSLELRAFWRGVLAAFGGEDLQAMGVET
ncbi:MAG: recombination-associated protein RdgC [Pseudomonadota bacterium]